MIGLIWAQAAGGVIGADGGMPWHLPEDLAHFRELTRGAAVIMGRRTWESLPQRYRPLPGRRNIVLTRQPGWRAEGAESAPSLEAALAEVPSCGDVWVIGGAEVFRRALAFADRVERTDLAEVFDGDVVAPELEPLWSVVRRDPEQGWHTAASGLRYRFLTFVPAGHPEDSGIAPSSSGV